MFRGKKYKESAKQIDRALLYDPKEGLELICKTALPRHAEFRFEIGSNIRYRFYVLFVAHLSCAFLSIFQDVHIRY